MEEPSRPLLHMATHFDPDFVHVASHGRRATSTVLSLTTGTGYSVFNSAIIPAIRSAQRDVVLVTCFWAPSVTRDLISEALKHLSEKALALSRKIAVRICFSSSSLTRNMLLPTPKDGQNYPPLSWGKLGLPDAEELKGLNMRVTRKFFWPFGIIHSKYVVVDRALAIFPSCNVSWERWFEVAISCQGPVVEHLLSFHARFWDNVRSSSGNERPSDVDDLEAADSHPTAKSNIPASTTLLPSPHTPSLLPNHLRPRALIGHCPCLPDVVPDFSATPLLNTTYYLLSTARSTIIMITPNLTEPNVLEVLLQALERGVHVCIWTNRDLMTMEQLVTAGTTTPQCVKTLQARAEQAEAKGRLKVCYFDGRDGPGQQHPVLREIDRYRETIPVKLHAKVTIFDGERILLGSGNMDAASWRTSQELGVLIESRAMVEEFMKAWKYDKLEP
ncbi:hypothetical protein H2200_005099 [Cladophialophora chaetospira]|uniref:PLD phosphodiesterase domain-containing protein n=1 Tax=Cladophialophora chaetospira TaxID=386627 RepID=A0AA39CJ98_9EURO|nr:hypothetical protein H2200_005099 [Cladophialophora chaetospira]